jgi:hypothetical protein
MKSARLFWLIVPFTLTAGCVQSHRAPAVVYYTPAPPPPTSDRPEARVYPGQTSTPGEPPPSAPPPGVSDVDIAVARSISQLFRVDPGMAAMVSNVETTVDRGVVTLRGSVPNENVRDTIVQRIGKLPGVDRVDDQLGVDYH